MTAMNVNLFIYGFFGFTMIFGLLLGLIRGVKRQTFRLVTILISALAAFFVARSTYPQLIGGLNEATLAELFASLGLNGEIARYLTVDVVGKALALPVGLIVAPMVFVVAYFFVSILLLIVHKIVCAIIGFRRKNNTKRTRFFGMIVGAVQGVLIGAIFMLPFFGIINTADRTVASIQIEEEQNEDLAELVQSYNVVSEMVGSNAAYRIFGDISGSVYEQLSTVKVGEETLKMTDMFETAFVIVGNMDGLSSISFEIPSVDDRAVIDSLLDSVGKNDYLLSLLSSVLRTVSEVKVADAENAPAGEEQNPLLTNLFSLFQNSTAETLGADLTTIKEVYYMLADAGLLHALTGGEGDILAILTEMDGDGNTLIAKVSRKISDNTHLAPMSAMLTEYAMTLALENAGVEGKTAEEVKVIVEDVKGGFNEILAMDRESYSDEDAYKAAVSTEVDEVLSEHEFDLTEEELDAVSTYIVDNMSEIEEITDADLANLISKYYFAKGEEGEIPTP